MAEKTEKPTDKRRKDSAKKGQTFKSKDLTTTICLLFGFYFIAYFMNFKYFISFYSIVLLHNEQMNIGYFLTKLMQIFFLMALPFIAVSSFIGIAMTLLQTRFSIATEAIKLNFKALNPVEGMKKIFNMRTLKELIKSICYLFVFILTCYILIHNDLKQALTVFHSDLNELITSWLALGLKAILTFIACSLVVLVIDFMAEYFLHFKEIKMDKHEVKRERKENDGNPEIKGARRRIHQDILSGEEMAAIRNSEMVLANPTHIAIAIYFDPEVVSLPFISFRAMNQKAKAAIAYAEKIGISVVRDIPLTRRIYQTYRQYSFISLNDETLMKIMNLLIWLRQVELAGMEHLLNEEEEKKVSGTVIANSDKDAMIDKES